MKAVRPSRSLRSKLKQGLKHGLTEIQKLQVQYEPDNCLQESWAKFAMSSGINELCPNLVFRNVMPFLACLALFARILNEAQYKKTRQKNAGIWGPGTSIAAQGQTWFSCLFREILLRSFLPSHPPDYILIKRFFPGARLPVPAGPVPATIACADWPAGCRCTGCSSSSAVPRRL